jgi:hypothetical protein
MQKFVVHTLSITQPAEHKLFTIRIPDNAQAVQAIEISCDRTKVVNPVSNVPDRVLCGMINIRTAITGQRIVSQPVFAQQPLTDRENLIAVNFLPFNSGFNSGYKFSPQWVAGEVTLLEGTYIDRLHESESGDFSYRVYITLSLII